MATKRNENSSTHNTPQRKKRLTSLNFLPNEIPQYQQTHLLLIVSYLAVSFSFEIFVARKLTPPKLCKQTSIQFSLYFLIRSQPVLIAIHFALKLYSFSFLSSNDYELISICWLIFMLMASGTKREKERDSMWTRWTVVGYIQYLTNKRETRLNVLIG